MRKRQSGVTLIELLMVMTVLGILASIAIPAYRGYTIRASRADGKAALLAVAGQLERCFTRFNAYDHDDCDVELPSTSTEGKYQVSATTLEATNFVLTASAVAGQGQDRDKDCGSFTLSSANARGISGTGDSKQCWGR